MQNGVPCRWHIISVQPTMIPFTTRQVLQPSFQLMQVAGTALMALRGSGWAPTVVARSAVRSPLEARALIMLLLVVVVVMVVIEPEVVLWVLWVVVCHGAHRVAAHPGRLGRRLGGRRAAAGGLPLPRPHHRNSLILPLLRR